MKNLRLLLPLAALGTTAGAEAASAAKPDRRPNILLILVDDLGYKDCGFTGSDFYETPAIDSLARRSVIFDNAYSGAGNSAPSRACLMTGCYTPRHGVYAVFHTHRGPKEHMRLKAVPNTSDLPLTCPTLAETMTAAGYNCGIAGKWHLGDKAPFRPCDRGFGYDRTEESPSQADFAADNDPKHIYKEVKEIGDFMEASLLEGKPFFALLSFHAVHSAWQARPEYVEYFASKPAGKQHHEPLYAAMIRHMDEAVGSLVARLTELGADRNTMIVFTSDNGGIPETSQAPLRSFKGTYYEGGIRVPTFIYYPGCTPRHCSEPVMNIDLLPTFAALAGAQPPAGHPVDGESLLPLVRGSADRLHREALFWHFPGYLNKPNAGTRDSLFRQRPVSVIRKGDWKLFLYHEEWLLDGGRERIDSNRSVELYDLKHDISERHDVASEQPAKRDELLDELLAWIDRTEAPLPTLPAPKRR